MADTIISVPKQLTSSFFFPDGKMKWEEKDEKVLNIRRLFIYEAAYYAKIESLKPWEEREKCIPILMEQWEIIKEKLEDLFKKRDTKAASSLMKEGIGLFIQFLHWANGKPVALHPEISFPDLPIKPVNVEERLSFLLSRPNVYHSYVQLVQLMVELEKGYYKDLAKKKLSP